MDDFPAPPALLDGLNPTLCDKYFAGTCTPAEQREIDVWAAGNPARKEALRGLRLGLVSPVYPAFLSTAELKTRLRAVTMPADADGSGSLRHLETLNTAVDVVAGARSWRVTGIRRRVLGTQLLRNVVAASVVAATVVSGVLVSIWIFAPGKSRDNGITRTYATAAGQQATIPLSDGSRVILAPRTTLRLVDFGARARSVELDGEAYFDVTHTDPVPFIVRSGGVTMRVLGTTFLVKHPTGETRVHVAVEHGKIRVAQSSRMSDGVTLTAGQIGDITDSTVYVSMAEEAPPGAELISGQLVFRHKPVMMILQALSRWYGYQFRYTDKTLAQRNVTIGISTQSSAEALAAVERVLAVNLIVIGDTVTLVPHPAQPAHGAPKVRAYDVWTPSREVGR